ncbi:beta-galactosidase [Cryobacterium sp.]|uniref:beta-galactosidase n=1 Tax=Cryobacterium sp. TaxID=1926290 RepID=UPI0026173AAF|nr:beta-galactosidase [Cryobacterium sp.]MCU1447442.1 beta-galactosidase [Cryobacterium sp.]
MSIQTMPLSLSSTTWTVEARTPAMANETDNRVGLHLDSRHLTRAGASWIPVSGEIHYSRVPRRRWAERIRQMQAGGITVVSFYVPWLHHVAERGKPRFDGNLDVGAFIDEIRAVGLDIKEIVRDSGISAPLWTATAWGGAQLPDLEVLPLYGGYGDGFWVDQDRPWDDPGIGADVRGKVVDGAGGLSSSWFPAATCEIGGGMATAYHRRPWPSALDVAAVSHCKIGNGSAWQGLYMYAGGTNPGPNLQESHASGYPNDMVELSYDFHSSIGEAGNLAPSHSAFRRQHFLLQAFGDVLADLPPHFPDVRPAGVEDTDTLRWAFRGDGQHGFLCIAWHQPHIPLGTYRDAQFRLALDDGVVTLPSRPVDIEPGTLAHWPVGLDVGGIRPAWATASVLTLLDGAVPTLVLVAEDGIPTELAVDERCRIDAASVSTVAGRLIAAIEPGSTPTRISLGSAHLDILVLPASVAGSVWVQATAAGHAERVLISDDEIRWTTAGVLEVRSLRSVPDVRVYDPATRDFTTLALTAASPPTDAGPVAATSVRDAAAEVPTLYGEVDGRPSAPSAGFVADNAAVFSLSLPPFAATGDSFLEIGWAGDVGTLLVDGRIVSDRFWDGSPWWVNLVDVGYTATSIVQLLVLPLATDSPVALPAAAAARLAASEGPLVTVGSIRAVRTSAYVEAR